MALLKSARNEEKTKNRKERLFFTLRDRIYSGYYLPREKLLETELSREMDVSRTVIREVLKELAAKGLVFIRPNKGTFVAELSYDMLKELIQIESVLEGAATFLAAQKLHPDHVKLLRLNLERAEMEKDPQAWSAHNRNFHRLIITSSGNKRLVELIRDNSGFLRYWFIRLSTVEEIGERNKAHREILKALEGKKDLLARKLMEQHVLKALGQLIERIHMANPVIAKKQ